MDLKNSLKFSQLIRLPAKQLSPLLAIAAIVGGNCFAQGPAGFDWLAGDHHIHSRYSVGWDRTENPSEERSKGPTPVIGGDAIYPIHMNALMARYYGLSWMVATDHGGPNHSKLNLNKAYPELVQSRLVVPEVLQFYGMEFDTPGADHSSLIIPFTKNEAEKLYNIESRFAKREPWPANSNWDTEPRMLAALREMKKLENPPIIIANHPSRSAKELGVYGLDEPSELRNWNDVAPTVALGMAGAPGHQANRSSRGGYRGYPTLGGFDQMTARVGGFWDSMISEKRRWWITANSDSHVHNSEGGSDFWPGEYSKTYVWAEKTHHSIIDGIRNGRMFVTTGDLIDQLFVTMSSGPNQARTGGTLVKPAGEGVKLHIRFRDPNGPNFRGEYPNVARVDLIFGEMFQEPPSLDTDTNEETVVIARFGPNDWKANDGFFEIEHEIKNVTRNSYIRVRGTNTSELEPQPDKWGEDPWEDLWFYSNPIFISTTDPAELKHVSNF